MSIPKVVEICISMAFLYLVLSLMCTTLNEIISTFLRFRGRNLAGAISTLMGTEKLLLEGFYKHGLIRSSTEAVNGRGDATKWKGKGGPSWLAPIAGIVPDRHPAYLDSKSVAIALIDAVMKYPDKPGSTPELGQSNDVKESTKEPGNSSDQADNSGAAAAAQAGADVKESPGGSGTKGDVNATMEVLGRKVRDLPQCDIQDIIQAALQVAGNDMVKVREEVAKSFDNIMDRLTGAFQRKMLIVSLLVGLVLAALFNVDSIAITRALWDSTELRNQITTSAASFVDKDYEKFATACPIGETPTAEDLQKRHDCLVNNMKDLSEKLAPFPLGWEDSPTWEVFFSKITTLQIFGIVWTAFALSFGAPFWFNTLQAFINIRGAGLKPEKEKDRPK